MADVTGVLGASPVRRPWRKIVAVGVTASALVLAGAVSRSARAAEPFDIPVVLPLTGPSSFLGLAEQKSLARAEAVLSEDGGIGGRPVHFVFYDDQSSAQIAVQLATQIISTKPSVILGSALVGMCNAMAPLMARGPVMYCLSPGLYPKPGGFVFSSSNATADLLAAQVRFFRLIGLKKIAVITSTDASGQDAARQIKTIFALPENKDVQVAADATFNPTDVSVAAQVQRLRSADPQAVIAWATGAAIGTVFKAIVDAGLEVPVATTDGNMTFAQMAQFKDILPKTLYIPSPEWLASERPNPPEVVAAKAAFAKAFKDADAQPDAAYTFAWDPAVIVVSAFKKLGPTATPAQVRDYLADLKDFAGINGVYDFQKIPQRGLDDSNVVITQWQGDKGTWQIVSQPKGLPLKQ
jgi:branched-chain amino acid transport system substrate-binding protein